jgi:hypothetical protein
MKKTNLLPAFVAITTILLNSLPCNATVWRVNNNPNYTQGCNHCFNDLQTAVNGPNVSAGDTIHLEASQVEYNAATITKPLVILGTGYYLNNNLGLQKNLTSASIKTVIFETGSNGSVIKGVKLNWSGSTAQIKIKVSNIQIESCWVEGNINFEAGTTYPVIQNVTIRKCIVNNRINNSNNGTPINNLLISNCYIGNSIFLSDALSPTSGVIVNNIIQVDGSVASRINFSNSINEFYNNIIINSSSTLNPIEQNNNSAGNIHDNLFTGAFPTWLVGGNNFSLAPSTIFVSTGSPDSILNVNPFSICPQCYTGAPTGTETMGIFGGADPYKLSGIPNIPAIYQLQSPLNVIQGTPVNVNISTRSND